MALSRQEILDRLAGTGGGLRDLSGLDLSGADLSRMDLRGVDLSRADLSAADLRWAVLEGADLRSSILRRADVRWAIMRGANLRQADLGRANLGWADITGADLTGAELEGANLESVDLSGSVMAAAAPRGGARAVALPAPALPGAAWAPPRLGALDLSRVTPAVLIGVALLVLLLVQAWGWLYRGAYFDTWGLGEAGLVAFDQLENFQSGLLDVVWLTLKTLLAAPLLLLALAIVLAVVLAPILLLWLFGERLLDDVVRPGMRPLIVVGLFIAYSALFVLVIIPGLLAIWRWLLANGLPGDAGLRMVFTLFRTGGFLSKVGLLLVLAACVMPLLAAWRAFSRWLGAYEPPMAWRLRYPALNAAVANARGARIFARREPLDPVERRRLRWSLAGLFLLLPTLLTGAGRVQAYSDMCDGGDLSRLQLFYGEPPANLQTGTFCARMVAETDTLYYLFFPSQTRETVPGDMTSRVPNLRGIEKSDEIQAVFASGDSDWCPSCGNPNGQEVFVVYPGQAQTQGTVTELAGNLVLIEPEEPATVGTVRLGETTQVTLDGGPGSAADILPGRRIVAFGAPAPEDPGMLDAREVNVLSAGTAPGEATALPPAVLEVDLGDPQNPVFNGSKWKPGSTVDLRLVRVPYGQAPDADTPGAPLSSGILVGPEGDFSAPVAFQPAMPTGPEYSVMAVDPATGQVAQGAWLAAPPPTPTPRPTQAPISTEEPSPTPEPEQATATAEAAATATAEAGAESTNTPFPTTEIPGGGAADCDEDEFEYDNTRPNQKEIFIGFGDSDAGQKHNFCPAGDIDLAFFPVKAGRWYRVRTTNLAQGVDTVMAVGDLSISTPCEPAGCWNDDRASLTFESEIVFRAIEDDLALITVDNRGSRSGTEASYDLSVVEFEPEATPTVSPVPSPTSTPTRTATVTPLPLRDPFEPNDTCRTAFEGVLQPRNPLYATLTRSDEDWFATVELAPGSYRLTLTPPDDMDYDMDLRGVDDLLKSRWTCPLLAWDHQDGDGVEQIDFTVSVASRYVVRVYPRPGSSDYDPHNNYRLLLEPLGTPFPTATLTPAPTLTPTPPTPTLTPPPPTLTATAVRPPVPPSPTP